MQTAEDAEALAIMEFVRAKGEIDGILQPERITVEAIAQWRRRNEILKVIEQKCMKAHRLLEAHTRVCSRRG